MHFERQYHSATTTTYLRSTVMARLDWAIGINTMSIEMARSSRAMTVAGGNEPDGNAEGGRVRTVSPAF
jgi:hypothetical protein